MIELVNDYFKSFSDKNLGKLTKLFSDDVCLTDWEINAVGKPDVIAANKKIFDSVQSISIEILRIDQIGVKFYCLLNISIDREVIRVLDVLTLDSSGRLIRNVDAYRQF